MSLIVTAAIWDEKNFSSDEIPSQQSRATRELWIDGSTLLILQAIGDRADEQTGYAFPGVDELRRRGRLQTDRGVRMCTERLKRTGHLVVLIEAHGEGYPNFYQVLTGRPERKILRDLLDRRNDDDGAFPNPQDADAYAALMTELREAALQWIMVKGFTHRLLPPAIRDTLVKSPRRRKNGTSTSGSKRHEDAGRGTARNRHGSSGSAGNRNTAAGSAADAENRNAPAGSTTQRGPEPEGPFTENRNGPSGPYMEEPSGSEPSVGVVVQKQQHQPLAASGEPKPHAVDGRLVQELKRLGVAHDTATELVARHTAERVETVLHAARTKRLKNRAGWIVKAFADEWVLEPAPRRRAAAPDPPPPPQPLAAVVAYEAAADRALEALPAEDRAALQQAAHDAVVRQHTIAILKAPMVTATLVHTELRRLVAERAGIPILGDTDSPGPAAQASSEPQ